MLAKRKESSAHELVEGRVVRLSSIIRSTTITRLGCATEYLGRGHPLRERMPGAPLTVTCAADRQVSIQSSTEPGYKITKTRRDEAQS